MELSSGSPHAQDYIKLTRGQINSSNTLITSNTSQPEIDVSKINFEDEETWLYSTNANEDCTTDIQDFLYSNQDLTFSNVDLPKSIDSRTFTRPKKRFSRPSIEKYNDDMYASSTETFEILADSKSYVILERSEDDVPNIPKPSFDLSQRGGNYFERMLANTECADSFQNMSPPSLANSMCSSTFANLMESSFIKDDPVLREIRDTDYSETILLQDSETPMFQSITESCSSINSDTPENFLKKVSFNGTYRKDKDLNGSNHKSYNNSKCHDSTLTSNTKIYDNNETYINHTYHQTPKQNNTFKKSDIKKCQSLLKSTIEVTPQDHLLASRTHTILDSTMETIKMDLSKPRELSPDLNRINYCHENENAKLNVTYNDVNRMINLKSTRSESADSLDRLSSISSSSRGSNKMLNMADVDAIVEMQEKRLHQAVSSTPITVTNVKGLLNNFIISPIISEDGASECDSTEDYKSVKSSQSSKTSLDNYISKPSLKNKFCVEGHADTKIQNTQKPSYSVERSKPMSPVRTNTRNAKQHSYSNPTRSNIAGSNLNLQKIKTIPCSTSNLKTMGPKLKGSYTSLRPISSNLPVAPPFVSNLNETMIIAKTDHHNALHAVEGTTRIVEVQPMPREKASLVLGENFVKPHRVKASGLPRPTGIPRPSTASRIPAPRSGNIS